MRKVGFLTPKALGLDDSASRVTAQPAEVPQPVGKPATDARAVAN
jgi:hypothetical protein